METKSTIKTCACLKKFVVTGKCIDLCPWCMSLEKSQRPPVDFTSYFNEWLIPQDFNEY